MILHTFLLEMLCAHSLVSKYVCVCIKINWYKRQEKHCQLPLKRWQECYYETALIPHLIIVSPYLTFVTGATGKYDAWVSHGLSPDLQKT